MDYTIFFHVGICWNNMALSYFSGLTSFFPRTNRAVGLLPNMQMTLFSSFFDYDIYLICDSYVLIFKIRVRDGSDLRFMNLNIIVRSSCRELFIGHISVRCTKVAFTTFEWIGLIIILIHFFSEAVLLILFIWKFLFSFFVSVRIVSNSFLAHFPKWSNKISTFSFFPSFAPPVRLYPTSPRGCVISKPGNSSYWPARLPRVY